MKEYKMLPIRIVALPFVFAIGLIYSLYQLGNYIINYLIYGGEFIALSRKLERKKIIDVFKKVECLIDTQANKNHEYAKYVCRRGMYYDIKENLWYDCSIEGGITENDLFAQFELEQAQNAKKE